MVRLDVKVVYVVAVAGLLNAEATGIVGFLTVLPYASLVVVVGFVDFFTAGAATAAAAALATALSFSCLIVSSFAGN